jgi:hypothetical protein
LGTSFFGGDGAAWITDSNPDLNGREDEEDDWDPDLVFRDDNSDDE